MLSYNTQVNSVTDLFSVRAQHNQTFQTLGYSQKGIGGNLYRYDSGSTATPDGGFVLPGIGGTLSFSGTTFNGTAGTGRFVAVDRTAADVTKFGALGDGATDCYAVCRRAIASLESSGGGRIHFPAGTYSMSGQTSSGASGTIMTCMELSGSAKIELTGDGKEVSKIVSTNAYPVRIIRGNPRGLKVEGLSFTGNTGVDSSAGTCFAFENFTDVEISNCSFYSFTGGWINCGNDANFDSARLSVTKCIFDGGTVYTASGIHLYQVRDVVIDGNVFTKLARAFDVEIDSARSASNLVFSNNIIRDVSRATRTGSESGFPIHIELEDTCDVRNVVISGNVINGVHDDPIGSLAGGVIGLDHNGSVILPPIQCSTAFSTDLFTVASNPFVDNDEVQVVTGNALPTGISANTKYFVINSTATTFKLSATSGGAAIDLTTPDTTLSNFVMKVVNDNASTDTFTLASHGLTNGRPVRFYTGGTIATPLVNHAIYWVVNSTANTFQVSSTRGGTPIDITAVTVGVLSVTSPCVLENVTIANNTIIGHNSNATTNTIWVDNCRYVTISGNILRECKKSTARGIIIRDSACVVVTGNCVDETYSQAFREMTGCRKNVIVGNRFKGTTFDDSTGSASTNANNLTGTTGF